MAGAGDGMGGLRSVLQAHAAAAPQDTGAVLAWPTALARAARDAAGLALAVTACRSAQASLAELLDMPADLSLIAMLPGPGEGLGVMILSPPVLAAAVEWQTLGRVLAAAPLPRKPTRTDAVLVQPLIDQALAGLGAAVDGTDDMVWAAGFRYASCLEDARALGLILEDAPYRVIRAEVSLAGDARAGSVLLALPAEGRGAAPPPRPDMTEAAAALVFQAALGAQVNAAQVTLDAVVARVSLPLSQILALAPGEVLRLPGAAVDCIDIEVPGFRRAAGGRLGQARGMRAVRLLDDAPPVERTAADLAPGLATLTAAMRRTGTG